MVQADHESVEAALAKVKGEKSALQDEAGKLNLKVQELQVSVVGREGGAGRKRRGRGSGAGRALLKVQERCLVRPPTSRACPPRPSLPPQAKLDAGSDKPGACEDRHTPWAPSEERDKQNPELAALLRKVYVWEGWGCGGGQGDRVGGERVGGVGGTACTPCRLRVCACGVQAVSNINLCLPSAHTRTRTRWLSTTRC